MGTSCTFIAQFECSICQGTLPDCTFCVLSCGHCFHAVCIHKWLERSSSCPGCRSHASKRKLRQLAGVDVVNTPCSGQHGGQVDNSREKKMSELQSQLDTAEQHVHDLSETVQQLLDQQAEHKREIKRFMQWGQELEDQRLQDSHRLTVISEELDTCREAHRTAVSRLELEQSRRKKAEAELQQVCLQNPSLSLPAMERLIDAQEQGRLALNQTQLLAILAQRNKQLGNAKATELQLQVKVKEQEAHMLEQLRQAQESTRAAEIRAAKAKQAALKQRNWAEAEIIKLQQEVQDTKQQLQDLQGVLHALEGSTAHAPRQQHQKQQQLHPAVGLCRSSDPKASLRQTAQNHGQDQLSDDEQLPCHVRQLARPLEGSQPNVTSALGPGTLLQQAPHITQAPSFVKASGQCVAAGGVQGQLLRHGPDGRGSTAKHAPSIKKRDRPMLQCPSTSDKRGRAAKPAGIVKFLERKGN